MSKYIDAEKLANAIKNKGLINCSFALKMERLDTLALIDELQQEQPSHPSNLDEAAEEYADYNSRRWHEDGDVYYDHSKIMDGFKAGAEWMSGQGFSFQDEVIFCDSTPFLKDADFDILEAPESFKPSDKVIVQIRKK